MRQQSAGLSLSVQKPVMLDRLGEKSGRSDHLFHGAFALLLRKHAADAVIASIFKEVITGDIWIPLYKRDDRNPYLYVLLKMDKPPALEIITVQKTTLIRATSQGVFTKLKTFERLLPDFIQKEQFEDMLPHLLKDVVGLKLPEENMNISDRSDVAVKNDSTTSEIQKILRQKLTRRYKTLKKALEKIKRDIPNTEDVRDEKRKAELLKNYLYRVKEGDEVLHLTRNEIEDESDIDIELDSFKSPGENLERYYIRAKKLKRGFDLGSERAMTTEQDINELQLDLDRLRNDNVSSSEMTRFLQKYDSLLEKEKVIRSKTGTMQEVAKGFRVFLGHDGALIQVGKSAVDNDDLCKKAKSNDFWFHAVNGKGSHVLIPVHSIKNKAKECTDILKKEAAMLALHFSQMARDKKGEVYFSRRHFIRKKKGMPAGLWQIDKAETLKISYTDSELDHLLEKET